jgi:hypothetical protein
MNKGTVVKIVPNTQDKEFLNLYDARIGSITENNPIAGYKGYEVMVWDYDKCINLDTDEVLEIKGKHLETVMKRY